MKGIFITFEGIEGCGKTTQIRLLADHLRQKGRDVTLTREPGGSLIGDKIRAILLNPVHEGMTSVTELLLYAAARNQHIEEVIRPAIKKGGVVLCDRYADATAAYQGAARKIAPKIISEVHRIATGGLMPDITILLDCPPEEGLARARERNETDTVSQGEDRFEREGLKFHRRVRKGYLKIAKKEPRRVFVVDATKSSHEMHSKIVQIIEKKLCGQT